MAAFNGIACIFLIVVSSVSDFGINENKNRIAVQYEATSVARQ